MTKSLKTRCCRGRRNKNHRPVVLTDRDIYIMILVGMCRYCSTDQIAREFFPTKDRCRRRLRQLYDADYIAVTLTSSTEPNLLSLSKYGINELRERKPELADRVRLAGSIRLIGVPHHLAVIDSRLYIKALGEKHDTPLLAWSNAGGSLGQEIGLDTWLVPDGLAELEVDYDIKRIAVEVDCGTESTKVLRNKLERYYNLDALGIVVNELWFVMATGKQRQNTVTRLVREAGVDSWTKVMSHERLIKRPVQKPSKYVGGGR